MKLGVSCPPLPQPIWGDASHWEKIVLNLISNAFKFTFEGEIGVALSWHGDHVELRVSDTGTGIPSAELPRIFERFHRVEGARGRSFEGTGIGLALVQELVQLHGGTVQVASEEGRGTSFVVSIPTVLADPSRDHSEPRREVAQSAPGAINPHVLEAAHWSSRTGAMASAASRTQSSGAGEPPLAPEPHDQAVV